MDVKKYEDLSPYSIAREENILVDYYDLGDKLAGVYANLNGFQVVLNSRMDNDRKDDCLQLLIEHHRTHRGIERRILKQELNSSIQIAKRIASLNRIIPRLMMLKRLQEQQ